MDCLFKVRNVFILGCIAFILTVAGCTKERQNPPVPVKNEVVATTTLLANIADTEKQVTPNIGSGHSNVPAAESQPPLFIIEMNQYGMGVAYIATVGDQVRVVHNGRPGKLYKDIESHTLTVSPDGKRVAYGAKDGDKWVAVVDNKEKGPFVERGRLSFSPDSRHVAYEARIGDLWYQFVDDTRNAGGVSYYDKAVFSNDSNKLFYVENTADEGVFKLVVSDLAFKKQSVKEAGSPSVVFSRNYSAIAAIERVGNKQRVIEFSFNEPDNVKKGALYEEVRHIAFSDDGKALSYIAKKDGKSYIVLSEKVERLPDGNYPSPPVIHSDNKGVGITMEGKDGAILYQAFLQGGIKGGKYKETGDLVYSNDGSHHAYVAIRNEKFTIVVNGKEGPFFERVISPRFSPDGKFLVYRARQDGKRFVVVADADGKIIRQHPGYERVFETTFTADGKSVAYGVKDGQQLIWKVEKL